MDINEALKSLDLKELWENEETTHMKEILNDIEGWLEDETYVQDWIESNLRSDEGLGE